MLLTFILAVFGWIFFRADSMIQAIDYYVKLFSNPFLTGAGIYGIKELLLCLGLVIIEWIQRDKLHALQFGTSKLFNYRLVRWGVYYGILMAIAILAGSSQTFIYFQF